MKKFLFFVLCSFFTQIVSADTVSLDWFVDGVVQTQTSCTIGGALNLPSAPTKYGYTFRGWQPGYTQLEYIQNSAGVVAYIDTGIRPKATTQVDFKMYYSTRDANAYFIGTGQTGYPAFNPFQYGNSNTNLARAYLGNALIQLPATVNEVHIVSYQAQNSLIIFDSETYYFPNQNFNQSNVANNIYILKGYGRLYYLRIYDNGTLVRDFIPARRNSDRVIGMYDLVTRTFFENGGSGAFTPGPEL